MAGETKRRKDQKRSLARRVFLFFLSRRKDTGTQDGVRLKAPLWINNYSGSFKLELFEGLSNTSEAEVAQKQQGGSVGSSLRVTKKT